MSRRAAGALLALAVAILLFGLWRWISARQTPASRGGTASLTVDVPELPAFDRRSATLWLPGPRGQIAPLEIELESAPDERARLRSLLAALLAAQPERPLAPLFPKPVEIGATVIGPDHVLYIDLRAVDGGGPPSAGATLEMQRVYSLVHTVLRDDPALTGVVLLWNGVQRSSFSGHVDTTQPLVLEARIEAR